MSRIFLSSITLCLGAILTLCAQGVDKNTLLTVYYVSSTMGDDENDGLSELTPKRHVAAITNKNFVSVRLKCGDVFFERICGFKNSVFECYGKGDKPTLCGFKILKVSDSWTCVDGDVWMIDLSDESKFTGYMRANSSNKYTANNIGLIYDSKRDKVYGHLVNNIDSLMQDGDFFMTNHHTMKYFREHPFDKLYWKTSLDPRKMGKLAFSMYDTGITSMTNCTIKDLAIVGFSIHGITGCNGCRIENCQIDLIGGATFVRDKNPWCRYGNGIEFWSSSSGNYVTGCLISRTYDCATTIQGNPTSKVMVKNNRFVRNRLYHCRQAFEHFLNDQGQDFGSSYENCSFEGNVAFEMGNNEFSSPESRDCNILSYETKMKSIDLCKNVFYGGNHMFGSWMNIGNQKNKVYLYSDQYVFHTNWNREFEAMLSGYANDLKKYFDLTGDNSEFVILRRGSLKAWIIKKKILREVGWKPVSTVRNYIKDL